jgi:hypothetical protein
MKIIQDYPYDEREYENTKHNVTRTADNYPNGDTTNGQMFKPGHQANAITGHARDELVAFVQMPDNGTLSYRADGLDNNAVDGAVGAIGSYKGIYLSDLVLNLVNGKQYKGAYGTDGQYDDSLISPQLVPYTGQPLSEIGAGGTPDIPAVPGTPDTWVPPIPGTPDVVIPGTPTQIIPAKPAVDFVITSGRLSLLITQANVPGVGTATYQSFINLTNLKDQATYTVNSDNASGYLYKGSWFGTNSPIASVTIYVNKMAPGHTVTPAMIPYKDKTTTPWIDVAYVNNAGQTYAQTMYLTNPGNLDIYDGAYTPTGIITASPVYNSISARMELRAWSRENALPTWTDHVDAVPQITIPGTPNTTIPGTPTIPGYWIPGTPGTPAIPGTAGIGNRQDVQVPAQSRVEFRPVDVTIDERTEDTDEYVTYQENDVNYNIRYAYAFDEPQDMGAIKQVISIMLHYGMHYDDPTASVDFSDQLDGWTHNTLLDDSPVFFTTLNWLNRGLDENEPYFNNVSGNNKGFFAVGTINSIEVDGNENRGFFNISIKVRRGELLSNSMISVAEKSAPNGNTAIFHSPKHLWGITYWRDITTPLHNKHVRPVGISTSRVAYNNTHLDGNSYSTGALDDEVSFTDIIGVNSLRVPSEINNAVDYFSTQYNITEFGGSRIILKTVGGVNNRYNVGGIGEYLGRYYGVGVSSQLLGTDVSGRFTLQGAVPAINADSIYTPAPYRMTLSNTALQVELLPDFTADGEAPSQRRLFYDVSYSLLHADNATSSYDYRYVQTVDGNGTQQFNIMFNTGMAFNTGVPGVSILRQGDNVIDVTLLNAANNAFTIGNYTPTKNTPNAYTSIYYSDYFGAWQFTDNYHMSRTWYGANGVLTFYNAYTGADMDNPERTGLRVYTPTTGQDGVPVPAGAIAKIPVSYGDTITIVAYGKRMPIKIDDQLAYNYTGGTMLSDYYQVQETKGGELVTKAVQINAGDYYFVPTNQVDINAQPKKYWLYLGNGEHATVTVADLNTPPDSDGNYSTMTLNVVVDASQVSLSNLELLQDNGFDPNQEATIESGGYVFPRLLDGHFGTGGWILFNPTLVAGGVPDGVVVASFYLSKAFLDKVPEQKQLMISEGRNGNSDLNIDTQAKVHYVFRQTSLI